MAVVRMALERLLHQHRQTVKALAHVRMSARQPNLHPGRNRNHRAPPSSASASAAAHAGGTLSASRNTRPLRRTSSIGNDGTATAFGVDHLTPPVATATATQWHPLSPAVPGQLPQPERSVASAAAMHGVGGYGYRTG